MRRLLTLQLTLLLALGCNPTILQQAREGLQKPTTMEQVAPLPGPTLWSSAGHRLVRGNATADGNRLLLHDGGRLYIWNKAQARMEQVIPVHDRWISSASISSQGTWILVRETTTYQPDGTGTQGFAVLDTGNGQVRWHRRFELKQPESYLHMVNFSLDESEVLAVVYNVKKKEAQLLAWSLSDGTLSRELSCGQNDLDSSDSQDMGLENLGGKGLYSHFVFGGTGDSGVAVWLSQEFGWVEREGELPRRILLPKGEDWRFAGTVPGPGSWPSVLVWTPSKAVLIDLASPEAPDAEGAPLLLLTTTLNPPWQTTRIIRDVAVISNQQMAVVEEGTNAVYFRIRSFRPSLDTPDKVVTLPGADSLQSASITPLEHGEVRVIGTGKGTVHQWILTNRDDSTPVHTSFEIPGLPFSIQQRAPSDTLAIFRGNRVIHLDFAEGKRAIHEYTPPQGRLVQRALALWDGRLAVELVGWGHTWLWLFLRWNGSTYDIEGRMRVHDSRGVRLRSSLSAIEIFEDSGVSHTVEWRNVPRRIATTYHQLEGTTVVRAKLPGQVMLPSNKSWRESALRAKKGNFLGWGIMDEAGRLAPIELEEDGQKSEPKLPNKPEPTPE